jgi:hypothetical protein
MEENGLWIWFLF